MRCLLVTLALVVSTLARPSDARAQSPSAPAPRASFLTVTREPGAESCPDTETLGAHIERVRGVQATTTTDIYHVTFSFRAGVYRASIRFGATQGQRLLRDRGATCASLEQATALTLALLLDSDTTALPEEEAAPPLAPPMKPAEPEPLAPNEPPAPPPPQLALWFTAGGAGLVGVLNPIAPALTGELGIGVARFRAHVGALWVPEQTLELAPGSVSETLVSGVARMCLAPWQRRRMRFDLCSGVYAGMLTVRATGYTRNDDAKKTWLALPLELAFMTTSAPVAVELAASALLPLRRSDFAIDNLGVAYRSPPLGALLSLRAAASWLL